MEDLKLYKEMYDFRNPKGCATAIIIRNNKVLVLKRNEDPFKGMWDLPGGYMSEGETPEETIVREMAEELGVEATHLTKIKDQPGEGFWAGKQFPTIDHFFLFDIGGQEIKLNSENSELQWIPLKEADLANIIYKAGREVLKWCKENLAFDMDRVRELVSQLDASARVDEQALYRAVLCGHISKIYEDGKLVAMGWIYPRQTMLRHQAVVEDMICDEAYRGRKYGEKVLIDLLDWAKRQGVEVVELTSGWHRKAAHGLYKKHGFRIHETAHMLLDIK